MSEFGFLGKTMHAHTQGMHMQPIYMRTHTTSMPTHASNMHMHTHPKNPNPETVERKHQNKETNNLTYSKYKHKVNLD